MEEAPSGLANTGRFPTGDRRERPRGCGGSRGRYPQPGRGTNRPRGTQGPARPRLRAAHPPPPCGSVPSRQHRGTPGDTRDTRDTRTSRPVPARGRRSLPGVTSTPAPPSWSAPHVGSGRDALPPPGPPGTGWVSPVSRGCSLFLVIAATARYPPGDARYHHSCPLPPRPGMPVKRLRRGFPLPPELPLPNTPGLPGSPGAAGRGSPGPSRRWRELKQNNLPSLSSG